MQMKWFCKTILIIWVLDATFFIRLINIIAYNTICDINSQWQAVIQMLCDKTSWLISSKTTVLGFRAPFAFFKQQIGALSEVIMKVFNVK